MDYVETGSVTANLIATFEDDKGNPIDNDSWVNKVEWSWY
jgi:hypothetical protein